MKKIVIVILSFFVLFAGECSAQSLLENARITRVHVAPESTGVYVWYEGGTLNGTPACTYPNASLHWFVIDDANPKRKELMTIALSAQLTGRLVRIGGYGTCNAGGTEKISWMEILVQ